MKKKQTSLFFAHFLFWLRVVFICARRMTPLLLSHFWLFVCLSVHLSHSWITSKRFKVRKYGFQRTAEWSLRCLWLKFVVVGSRVQNGVAPVESMNFENTPS